MIKKQESTINSSMNINSYSIVTETTVTDMVKKIKNYIDAGWQPLGGIQVNHVEGKTTYIQAVVQYHH